MVATRDEFEIYASSLLSKTNVMPTVLILYWILSAADLYLYPNHTNFSVPMASTINLLH